MHIVVTAPSPGWRICVLLTHLCQLKTVWQPWTIQAVALGCETTAPCDTSFKARRIEISLLTCVCNASTCIFLLQSIFCLTWINVFSITKISVRTQKWKHNDMFIQFTATSDICFSLQESELCQNTCTMLWRNTISHECCTDRQYTMIDINYSKYCTTCQSRTCGICTHDYLVVQIKFQQKKKNNIYT